MAFEKGNKLAGSRKGIPNKGTAEIKAAAQKHGADAVNTLARLMKEADSDQAKIAAAKELLDRGYGKATQPISGDEENPLRSVTRIELVGGNGS